MQTTQVLTDKLIQNISTEKSRLQITDAKTTGLKLRVSRSGHKSFAIMIRDKAGTYRTHTIGTYPAVSLKKAREVARQTLVDVRINGNAKPSAPMASRFEKTTLRELLDEVEPIFALSKKSWRKRGKHGARPYTRAAIELVFARLLDTPVESITPEQFGAAANSYKPVRPLRGKTTANGQVSQAIAYLAPVLDWAAHRGTKYSKIGAGRSVRLDATNIRLIHDPATSDPSITGKRDRVLTFEEIASIYPLLRYPTPEILARRKVPVEKDFGPIALRFLLLTLARREEVAAARWGDFDFQNGVWIKRDVKDTKGKKRTQRLPLSDAALNLVKALPGYSKADPLAFVFPNHDGGRLDNWNRVAAQVQKGSRTEGWTRHDLRRTGATILEELRIPIQTIDEILDHTNRFAHASVSGSASHYMIATRIMLDLIDPKVEALNKLSEALDHISASAAKFSPA